MTPLQGPQVGNKRVYAFAQGPIHLDDITTPTTGRIYKGCRLKRLFRRLLQERQDHAGARQDRADFQVAQDTAELINSQLNFRRTKATWPKRSTRATSK